MYCLEHLNDPVKVNLTLTLQLTVWKQFPKTLKLITISNKILNSIIF